MRPIHILSKAVIGVALSGLFFASPLPADTDAEARLEQLQKQMENAINQGQALPPGILEEMQKLIEEMMKGDAEDEPDQKLNWVSAPFRGRVTISVQGAGRYSVKDGGTFSASISRSATAMIHGWSEVRNEEGEIEDYIPQGIVQTSIDGRHTMVGASKECTLTASHLVTGSDRRTMGKNDVKDISVMLDPERKVYTIDLPSGWADSSVHEAIHGCGVNEEKTSSSSVAVTALPNIKGKEEKTEYDYRGPTLSGDYNVPAWASVLDWEVITGDGFMPDDSELLQMIRKEGDSGHLIPVQVHVSWNLSLEGDDVEAVIEPMGNYDQWLPEGGFAGAGNMIKAKVRITKPEGAKGYIHFRLADVSRVKGLCMNHPLSNPDTHPDLTFNKAGCSKGIWVGPDGLEAKTESEVNEAVVAVQALDYGAWGRLEAQIKLVVKGQERQTRAVVKPMGTDWLTIPRDDDEDHVADAWARQMQINDSGVADNDAKPGKQYAGDGLSVYEEYRGFIVQGKHVRTDPKVKDLFVWDPDGLVPRSKIPSGAFGPMVFHLVNPEEIKTGQDAQHRIINLNYDPDRHVVDQHGLFIFIGEVASSGYTFESVTNPKGEIGPPVMSHRIEINPAHILKIIHRVLNNFKDQYARDMGEDWPDPAFFEAKLEETIAFAVAHEMAHGVGICHHQPTDAPPYSCLMSQPKISGTEGFCSYKIFKGDYCWGYTLCEECLNRNMVSDIFKNQSYLPAE